MSKPEHKFGWPLYIIFIAYISNFFFLIFFYKNKGTFCTFKSNIVSQVTNNFKLNQLVCFYSVDSINSNSFPCFKTSATPSYVGRSVIFISRSSNVSFFQMEKWDLAS